MDVSQLDYELPAELIAQAPLEERAGARLMCLGRGGAGIVHRRVLELPELMPPALWVLNDTKVIPARLFLVKDTGGRVEFLLVERLAAVDAQSRALLGEAQSRALLGGGEELWLALGRTRKGVRVGMTLCSDPEGLIADVRELRGEGEVVLALRPHSERDSVADALERVGQMPLPPYIRRAPDARDALRYQTVFAAVPGAVAAPTAGLHLSQELIEALRARGHRFAHVTLHVGPGTFAPLRADKLNEHRMHAERYVIPQATALAIAQAKTQGTAVLAVGTTVVRTLEASAADAHDGEVHAGSGATDIFIYPPYRFRVVDALLTNFHLPRSTLLALVMAFAGTERIRNAYTEAVRERYRFFSYGDAMLIRGTL